MTGSMGLLKMNDKNAYFRKDQTDFKCNECREAFQKPILATISSSNPIQTYYACPHCLAKVSEIKDKKDKEKKSISLSMEVDKKTATELEENVKCKHSMGYLKRREKNKPIPEECLTCSKMIECMLH